VWDDTGTGGKRGSFWSVNTLCLLVATEGHEPPHPATTGGAARAEKGSSHNFADLPTEQFTASRGFTDKTWVAAVAALKMRDLSHTDGMTGAEDGLLAAHTSNGTLSASGVDRQVMQIPQTKDGWLEIEAARGKWRRLRFNLDSNGKITCWHDRPDDRVPFPARFEVRELKNARAGKHAFRLEFANAVTIESQIFPSHRKVSKIALAAPSDEDKESWMRVLGMAGRMLPGNHINAKSSAAMRAEDAAQDRHAAAEASTPSRTNGLAVAETLNRVANANLVKAVEQGVSKTPDGGSANAVSRGSMPSAGPGGRGSLPTSGPSSSTPTGLTQSSPPARRVPAAPAQTLQRAADKNAAADATAQKATQIVLPSGWTAHKDPDTNLSYYYHAASGTSSWEVPKAGSETATAPTTVTDVFEDCKEPEQAAAVAQATATTAPKDLGGGWTVHLDPDSGITYFHHATSGKSQWERPDAAQLA